MQQQLRWQRKTNMSLKEDLRKWFNPSHPEGGWKRINSKGEAIGPCAREPGEPKPKCMSNEKRASLSKKERASAVAAKRRHDPVADRSGKGGKPVNVSNFGKGKLSEEMEQLDEKNVPTNPSLWSRAKSLARSKFDGKKKGADVAKPSVQAVKQEEVEQIDEKKGYGESDPLQNRADYAASNKPGQVYKKTHSKDKVGMSKSYAYDIKRTGPKGKLPEEVELDERTLSSDEMSKREDYVKGMKKKMAGFKQRYGERAKSVMYATATSMAKKKS